MNPYPDLPNADPAPRATPAAAWRAGFALLLAAVATAALAALALLFWQQQSIPAFAPGPLGMRYAVQLQNGQMFYGVLRDVAPRQLQLDDIYYVQPFTQADGKQGNRIVSRQKNDWHGPRSATLPVDKLVVMEPVDPGSQLAKLIEQDKQAR